MILSLVSWPRSFKANKRPGVGDEKCFPPPAGMTRPLVAVMASLPLGDENKIPRLDLAGYRSGRLSPAYATTTAHPWWSASYGAVYPDFVPWSFCLAGADFRHSARKWDD